MNFFTVILTSIQDFYVTFNSNRMIMMISLFSFEISENEKLVVGYKRNRDLFCLFSVDL